MNFFIFFNITSLVKLNLNCSLKYALLSQHELFCFPVNNFIHHSLAVTLLLHTLHSFNHSFVQNSNFWQHLELCSGTFCVHKIFTFHLFILLYRKALISVVPYLSSSKYLLFLSFTSFCFIYCFCTF